jgi:hypothetical protein
MRERKLDFSTTKKTEQKIRDLRHLTFQVSVISWVHLLHEEISTWVFSVISYMLI